jgi:hypothetical protein
MSTSESAQGHIAPFDEQVVKLLTHLGIQLCAIIDVAAAAWLRTCSADDAQLCRYVAQVEELYDFISYVLEDTADDVQPDLEALRYHASDVFTPQEGSAGGLPLGYPTAQGDPQGLAAYNSAYQAYSELIVIWEGEHGSIPSAEVYAATGGQLLGKRRWDEFETSAESGDADDSSHASSWPTSRTATAQSFSKRRRLQPRSRNR